MLNGVFSGKRVAVTGGANGIGAAIVRAFADAGVSAGVVLDLPDAFGRTMPPAGWREIGIDLRDDDSVSLGFGKARKTLEGIDVLVAVAGVVPAWTSIAELDPPEWDDVFRVNARGVMRSMQGVLPAMGVGGAIVVIASQNAWRGNAKLASYTASKHAALGLVRSAALELGPRGIRVNAVGPGSIATEAYRSRLQRRADADGLPVEEALSRDGQGNPLRRLATAEEVAKAVLFLASDLASAVTGHILPVGAPLS